MADIVLINPRFEVSFWGMEYALPFVGKRANLPVACLPLLAALTPAGHSVTLIDENVEAIDFERVARADIVGLTGMSVQRERMTAILGELKRRGAFVVVGGPWVTVQEDYFAGLADAVFVGEAEETWPRFLQEWSSGRHQKRYEQTERSDMTRLPTPRFDMLKMKHYLFGSVQFSRGCPFQCEFCDIIVTFGRRPRLKTAPQIIAELEALRKQNMRVVFIVDDNLIGNKKAIKVLLRELIAYQRANGYPFDFLTEASLDLAEDPELMNLMVDANFGAVFIGIESPNEKALRETKKFQNVRPAGTIAQRVRRVQDAGLEVMCGMILGFDNDDATVFGGQRDFLREARIPVAMVGMLHAIPKTPLHARLQAEGRLDARDYSPFGTNVIPLQIGREQLRDGFIQIMKDLYEPAAFFDRFENFFIKGKVPFERAVDAYYRQHRWTWLETQARKLLYVLGLYGRLVCGIPEADLRREYRRRLRRFLRYRKAPGKVLYFLVKCALHYHFYRLARRLEEKRENVINVF